MFLKAVNHIEVSFTNLFNGVLQSTAQAKLMTEKFVFSPNSPPCTLECGNMKKLTILQPIPAQEPAQWRHTDATSVPLHELAGDQANWEQ